MNDVIYAGQEPPASGASLHGQPCWALYYCTRGAGHFSLDELELPCCAGELVVFPAGVMHSQLNPEETACICLCIDHATMSFRHPITLADDENQSLLHLFQDALYLYQHHPELHETLLPAYGHLIAQHISVRRSAAPRNLLVEDIAQSITQNYPNPNFDLDSVLKSAPYCYDYLCRLFRQEMHTTPHKYLAALRLQTAADILRIGTSRSITEVARMCGYQDPLYFSRMFKKKYGVSPREYARQQPDAAAE